MARSQLRTCRLGVVLLLGVAIPWVGSRALPANHQLVINSISVQGTNVALSAAIPGGLRQVTLEMRPTLDASWKETEALEVPADGGEVVFTTD